ncbi:pupal cuticle protein 36a [Helicoverpa armigera]|uniref:pupal cuticle protein 36a n=1 Tax=Helicoverpa armigera TaxID=29058 RepID=UPI003083E6A9
MKLFIVLAAVALAQAAKLDKTYLPPNAQSSAGSAFLETPRLSNGFQDQTGAFSNGFSNTDAYSQNGANSQNDAYSQNGAYSQTGAYSGFEARPERAQAAFERNAAILRQDNSNDGETYAYAYETENGISAEENGVATNGVQAQGGYSYTGDDGQVYSVRYTADENGFQPQGDHLPTPPPIPEEILKALEQNARDEAAGIYDDGSYSEGKYEGTNQQQYYNDNAQAINYNNAPSNNYNDAQSNNYNNADAVVTNNAFLGNDATGSGSSVAGVQKAYLPPFAQRNNQRSGARQSSFNARDGYRY